MAINKRVLYCSYLLLLDAIISMFVGVGYCSITKPMPYHLAYLGMSFDAIRAFNPRLAIFMMFLIKGVGISLLSLGMFEISIALKPFRRADRWVWFTLWPAVSIILIPLMLISFYMDSAAKWLVLFYLLVFLAAMIIPAKDFLGKT